MRIIGGMTNQPLVAAWWMNLQKNLMLNYAALISRKIAIDILAPIGVLI